MNAPIDDIGLWEAELRHGHLRLQAGARTGGTLKLQDLDLASRFEPVYSRAHGRPVGHRACLDVRLRGRELAPKEAAAAIAARGCTARVAALEPGLHMSNYDRRGDDRGWLVLGVPPAAVDRPTLWPPLPQDLFSSAQYAPPDVVLEVSVDAAASAHLRDFAAYHQELGFTVALSDFAEHHADLAAIWTMRPNLVSLRLAALRIAREDVRLLAGLVRVLHESGAMVEVRGVDDDDARARALATEADLLEGRRAAMPPAGAANSSHHPPLFELRTTFARSVDRLRRGQVFESACEALLSEAGVLRCYLLDQRGVQLTENLSPVGTRCDPRYWPLANAAGACWAHRDYYRSALAHPDQVMLTPPYFSLPDGRHCVTLSAAVEAPAGLQVLCCDVAEAAGSPPLG